MVNKMIYIDELILLNFIIDYVILSTLTFLLKKNVKKRRIFLSCLVGQLSILYLFVSLNTIFLFLFKLILGIGMILVLYGYSDIKTLIKEIVYFYILCFFLGGTLYYFKIENLIHYQYILLFIPIIMNIYKYFEYNLKSVLTTRYKVTIYLNNGKVLYLNGFLDTGNSLMDPYHGNKIIIINKEVNENYFFVPYKTIDSTSLLKCFNPKKVYIDGLGQRNDITVGITNKKFKGYNCLLNYKLMEG